MTRRAALFCHSVRDRMVWFLTSCLRALPRPRVDMLQNGARKSQLLRNCSVSSQTYADALDAGAMTLADVLDEATALPVRRFPTPF